MAIAWIPLVIVAALLHKSTFESLGPGEAIVFFLMIIFIIAFRWSIPTGEVIITERKLLFKFNRQQSKIIPLDRIMVAQLIRHINFAYYRMTLSDHSVHRIFVLGDYETFADCLPQNVKVYKSRKDVKGGQVLSGAFGALAVFGMLAGIGLGMLALVGLDEAFDGVTNSEFWSIVIVVSLLFGPMI